MSTGRPTMRDGSLILWPAFPLYLLPFWMKPANGNGDTAPKFSEILEANVLAGGSLLLFPFHRPGARIGIRLRRSTCRRLKQAEDQGTVSQGWHQRRARTAIVPQSWLQLDSPAPVCRAGRRKFTNNFAYTLARPGMRKSSATNSCYDLHYASSWADPGKQPTPEQWKNLTHKDAERRL